MIRNQWNSLTNHQRAVLTASAIIAAAAVFLWLLSAAAVGNLAPGSAGSQPRVSATASSSPTQPAHAAAPRAPLHGGPPPAASPSVSSPVISAGTTPQAGTRLASPPTAPSARSGATAPAARTPPARQHLACTLFPVAASQKLTIRDGDIPLVAYDPRRGPGLSYRSQPPTLSGSESHPAFRITFAVLSHDALISTPEDLPSPGPREFVPVLSGTQLSEGSVVGAYATAASANDPSFLAVIAILKQLASGEMEFRYRTYAQTCNVSGKG